MANNGGEHLFIEAPIQIKPTKLHFISFLRGLAILNDSQIKAIIKKANAPLMKCLTKLVDLYADEKTPRNLAIPELHFDKVKKATKSLRKHSKRRRANAAISVIKIQLQKKTGLLRLIAEDFVNLAISCDQDGRIAGETFNPFVELSEMLRLEKTKPVTANQAPIITDTTTVYEMRDTIVV